MNRTPSIPPVTYGTLDYRVIYRLLAGKARTVLEIGAHDGRHTALLLDAAGPDCTIHAFECDPRAAKRYRWRTHPNVKFFEIAIGAQDGTATFHMSDGMPPRLAGTQRYPDGWDQSGSLRAPKHHLVEEPWCRFERTIEIPVRTLDNWSAEQGISKVDFIWADVQGAEGDLIEGGRKTLAATKYFYTEYSDKELYDGQITLTQMLSKLETFSIVTRWAGDVLLRNQAVA